MKSFWVLFALILLGTSAVGQKGEPRSEGFHTEWTSFPVGGMLLFNRTVKDSLGRSPTMILPPGAELWIPRVVPGPDPRLGS